jgi:hypothetical protein
MRRSMLLVRVVAVCVAAGLAVSISSAGDPAGPVTLAQWSGYGSVGQDADSVVWCRQASSSP